MTLTEQQIAAIVKGEVVPLTVAGQECVLVLRNTFERLREDADPYDARPWTREEIDLLADEAEALISDSERIPPPHERQTR